MKYFAIILALLAFVAVPIRAADSSWTVIADFDKDTSGFADNVTRVEDGPHDGKGCGKIEGSFAGQQEPWTVAMSSLTVTNELTGLRFWVKSSDANGLTFRMIDSTGQVHQQRPTFPADGKWHQVTISSFDSGKGYQNWGGANDAKVHWPVAQYGFILEKANLNGKDSGTLFIDTVEAQTKGAVETADTMLAKMKAVSLADFEDGADGFEANLTSEATDTKSGKMAGKIVGDFSEGGGEPWIVTSKKLGDDNGTFKAIRFWVRSTDANGLTFRLVDSTGQVHQQRPVFKADGTWQQITITTFESGHGYQRWGGADDGKFHWPAGELSFILEKANLGTKDKGTLWIDGVEELVEPDGK